jgi:hypothetical protein
MEMKNIHLEKESEFLVNKFLFINLWIIINIKEHSMTITFRRHIFTF